MHFSYQAYWLQSTSNDNSRPIFPWVLRPLLLKSTKSHSQMPQTRTILITEILNPQTQEKKTKGKKAFQIKQIRREIDSVTLLDTAHTTRTSPRARLQPSCCGCPVQCPMGTLMQERAEQDGLCPKIRLSASTLLQAAAQMPEGKQAVRMVNREGEKNTPGKQCWHRRWAVPGWRRAWGHTAILISVQLRSALRSPTLRAPTGAEGSTQSCQHSDC